MTDLEMLRGIQRDCERDARAYDGKPLTGAVVGEAHGNTLAMVATLALIVERVLTEKATK